jgi:hypothetical protein
MLKIIYIIMSIIVVGGMGYYYAKLKGATPRRDPSIYEWLYTNGVKISPEMLDELIAIIKRNVSITKNI